MLLARRSLFEYSTIVKLENDNDNVRKLGIQNFGSIKLKFQYVINIKLNFS